MYCPRCGAHNTETTKFCRQCGLPLAPIADFVTSGGTGSLTPPQNQRAQQPPHLIETSEMLALRYKRTMTILAMCIAPVVLSIIGEELFNAGEFVAVLFLMIPLGIMWAISRYRIQLRQLQEQQLQQYYAQQQSRQPMSEHTFQQHAYQPPLPPPPTNPINVANPTHPSVTEEETQKLLDRQQ